MELREGALRRFDCIFAQILPAAVSSFRMMAQVAAGLLAPPSSASSSAVDTVFWTQLDRVGYLVGFESLLSTSVRLAGVLLQRGGRSCC